MPYTGVPLIVPRYNRDMGADRRHVVIAGAGIIGLACALELRCRGLEVTVFEAGEPMREASWAAGGMLAVDDPENPAALHPFSQYSRSLYDRFLANILDFSGIHVPWRTQQTLQLTVDDDCPPPAGSLSYEEAQAYVAGLDAPGYRYTLLEEASLDPRDLCTALPAAARAAGVEIHAYEPVLSVGNAAAGTQITTARGIYTADVFLNCCGAWTPSLNNATWSNAPGIQPTKGQMLVVAQPARPPLTRVLRSPEVYLIPRGDGRIAIGATIEEAGYTKQVDPAALAALQRRAAALWPAILHAPLLESWAGLRPGSADGLPFIGRNTIVHGGGVARAQQWIASGHYRNGILLAPGTAQAMADLICGVQPAIDLARFAPQRLLGAAACDKQFAAAL